MVYYNLKEKNLPSIKNRFETMNLVWYGGGESNHFSSGEYLLLFFLNGFFFPTKVNQVSATVGKDFTVTPSKQLQFDPGTSCVSGLFHVP